MALRARGGVVCTALVALSLSPTAAHADVNVLPVAGGGSNTAESADALDAKLGSPSQDSPQSVAFVRENDYSYTSYVIADSERCRVRRVTFNAYNFTDIGTISTIAGSGAGCPGGGGAFQPTDTPATS